MINSIRKNVKAFKNKPFNVEVFDSANEVVETSKRRSITSSSFTDYSVAGSVDEDWCGVASLEEAQEMLRTGYQPTVDKMKSGIKANVQGQSKRISFSNDVVGFAPIVPLALQGVPNSMLNSTMKPIKAKVLNVFYEIGSSWSVDKEKIIEAGEKVLAAIMELEMQGYKFNLYATQSYWDGESCDMLCTKIKSSNTPLDLKRISFPLTHTAYFRVIGFDWYSRTPNGKYRSGYGHPIAKDFDEQTMTEGFTEIFGKNCVVFACRKIMNKGIDHIKDTLKGGAK